MTTRPAATLVALTHQQRRCLLLMSHGLTNTAIGRRLGLSPDTVKTHLYWAYKTLGVHDRGHAVRRCFECGIFPMERAS